MRDLPLGIRPRLINKTPQEAVAVPAAASCRYINSRPVRTPSRRAIANAVHGRTALLVLRCVWAPGHCAIDIAIITPQRTSVGDVTPEANADGI